MRADAEIDEGLRVLDGVAGHLLLAGGLLVDQLHLERLAALGEKRLRFVARPHLPLVRQIFCRELLHLLLNLLEILRHERPLDHEVVEEALVGGRADAALRAGKQAGDGGGQQVGGAVTEQRQRFRASVGDDAERRVFVDGI